MQLIADDAFRSALRNLPKASKEDVSKALEELLAADSLKSFEATGRDFSRVDQEGFELPVKDNYQNTLGTLDGVLLPDGKVRVKLTRYF
jgi:hypothetical protein